MPGLLRALAILPALCAVAPTLRAQEPAGGFPPQAAAERMVLPSGFHADVYASEPDIRQPIAACFDERGRMWVVEYLQFPNPAGLTPVTRDVYLRTVYDKIPLPPPKGVKGADRIKILEDTDGDGKADKTTTFVDGLNLASGVAVGRGGVFVAQTPYLLFYPDKNKDDKPDGDPEVLLSGFGLEDTHSIINSLVWGPDGWLYGAQGSTSTAKIRGIEFQQGVWRYHPETKRFELFAEGGGNTWGLDFDSTGNAFGSSNGAYIAFHMVQGGYYLKGFAKHGPLHNPYTFGYFNNIEYEGPKHGGHVTPGGIIYKGGAFPPEFEGAFIGGNILSNAVYWHPLKPKGSTYAGRHGGTLVDARDLWFRPIDLLTGPDGALYVVDWYDRRAAHLDPRDTWDKTNGRVYRIRYGERREVARFDLSKLSTKELVEFRTSRNDWHAAEARRILWDRRDPALIADIKALLMADADPVVACRDLWALAACGGFDDPTALALLDHPVGPVRGWTIRLLGDEGRLSSALADRLARLAATEPDSQTRSVLASSAKRFEAAAALPILDKLIGHDEDAEDTHIPLLIWWAIERHSRDHARATVDLFASPESRRRPIAKRFLLPRLARLLAARGSEGDIALCVGLSALAADPDEKSAVLSGIEEGLVGRKPDPSLEPLRASVEKLRSDAPGDLRLLRIAASLGSQDAIDTLLAKAGDERVADADRSILIELIGRLTPKAGIAKLAGILADLKHPGVSYSALSALAGYDQPEAAAAILAGYPRWDARMKARAIDLLCSRPAWASALMNAVAQKRVPRNDISSPQILGLSRFHNSALDERIRDVWGKPPSPGAAAAKRIAEVRGFLVEGDKGNADRGKKVFEKTCSGCHRLGGIGKEIGPNLAGADRGNLDFLLVSLVDPSAVIRKEFLPQLFELNDGRVLSGLVVEETDRTITIFDTRQERTVVPRDRIEAAKAADVSIMPTGLLDALQEADVRDLFRFLQSAQGQ